MRPRTLATVAAGLFLACAPTPALASSPTAAPVSQAAPMPAEVVGTEQAVSERLGGGRATTTIKHAGSSYVKVHIATLSLRSGSYLTVKGADGRETHRYSADPTRTKRSGDSLGTAAERGFWAMSVEGDTAVVTLHNASGSRATIDRIARGFTDAELAARDTVQPKSICGSRDYRDAVCYRSSHATEYARSRAVARILIGGTSACTAWRVGANNRMLTNNHCFSSTSQARSTEVQFNYDCPTCGGTGSNPVTKVTGDTVLKTSSRLDYTLYSVQNFGSISGFGTLTLDSRRPAQNEEIYIAGHPRAQVKKLSIASDQNNGNCRIDVVISGVNSGYRCDTEGGSSGSPVLARSSHKVIALHHLGGCPNQGTRIELIEPEIRGSI